MSWEDPTFIDLLGVTESGPDLFFQVWARKILANEIAARLKLGKRDVSVSAITPHVALHDDETISIQEPVNTADDGKTLVHGGSTRVPATWYLNYSPNRSGPPVLPSVNYSDSIPQDPGPVSNYNNQLSSLLSEYGRLRFWLIQDVSAPWTPADLTVARQPFVTALQSRFPEGPWT